MYEEKIVYITMTRPYMKKEGWEKHPYRTPKSQKRIFIEQQLSLVARLNKGTLPPRTLTELGNAFGVSRERIRQIGKAQGFFMPHSKEAHDASHTKVCEECGKEFIAPQGSAKFCSGSCRYSWYQKKYWLTLTCLNCKRVYKKTKVQAGRVKHHFCSKFCQGQYLGKHYSIHEHHNHKYPDTAKEMKEKLPEEFTAIQFARAFGYKTYNTSCTVLNNLEIQRKVKKIRKGTWKIL